MLMTKKTGALQKGAANSLWHFWTQMQGYSKLIYCLMNVHISSLAPSVCAVWVSAEKEWQMKLLFSISNSEDNLNEEKTKSSVSLLWNINNVYGYNNLSCISTYNKWAFITNLNIWVKTALTQTLPVLSRFKTHLICSWSEVIAGY